MGRLIPSKEILIKPSVPPCTPVYPVYPVVYAFCRHLIRFSVKYSRGRNNHRLMQDRGESWLEVGGKAQGEASRRPDGVAGKQPAEVDHVENVGKILSVDLKLAFSHGPTCKHPRPPRR